MLASEYCNANEYAHYLVCQPASATHLVPIPSGTVRGRWVTPALTAADEGKTLTIEHDKIFLDQKWRNVLWVEGAPEGAVNDATILDVGAFNQGLGRAVCEKPDGTEYVFNVPYMAGDSNETICDIAFAHLGRGEPSTGNMDAKFFMPVESKDDDDNPEHRLCDVSNVSFEDGRKCFLNFVGAVRQ